MTSATPPLEVDRVLDILEYLATYQYASRRHIAVLMLWHTGCRVTAFRQQDIDRALVSERLDASEDILDTLANVTSYKTRVGSATDRWRALDCRLVINASLSGRTARENTRCASLPAARRRMTLRTNCRSELRVLSVNWTQI